MSSLRVLHIVGNLNLGGGQKLTALVASGLKESGIDVEVVCLSGPGHLSSELTASGVPLTHLGIDRSQSLKQRFRSACRMVSVIAKLLRKRWTLVHTHMFRTSLLAIPARMGGARVMGTSHRIYYPRIQPIIERLVSLFMHRIVVDSEATAKILQAATRIRPDKYVVIHNGIDTIAFSTAPSVRRARHNLGLPPPPALVVGCIAHLAPHKGQQHLIRAFAQVAKSNIHLVLVGDGPLRESLHSQAEELNLSNSVHLLGAVHDLPTVLASFDLIALPSIYEGFGIVQAEAMYMRLPVVGTNAGGATEVVEHGVTGLLVPFGDVDALAQALLSLLSDPSLRQTMGEAGRARVEHLFTKERMTKDYIRLYEAD